MPEFWKHTKAVTANYQKLAEILLKKESESWQVDRLLSLEPGPVPEIKRRGYSIWSAGVFAEAFACFPEIAFPRLLDALRLSDSNDTAFVLFKSLTMWGDEFAEALSDWLDDTETDIRLKALHGLSLYARQLQAFSGPEVETTEKRLQRENYPELVRFMRGHDERSEIPGIEEVGAPPAPSLSGRPLFELLDQLRHLLCNDSDAPEQIATLRCLWQLHASKTGHTMPQEWLLGVTERIAEVAKNALSRTLEREAVIALCHLECERGSEYIRAHWFQDPQRRSMAAEVLGIIRTEGAFQMLKELVTDAAPEARRKAISSLESFEPAQALAVLSSLTDSDRQVHRQILRSRSKFTQKPRRKKRQRALYFISPLALLRRVPRKPIFSEQELNTEIGPEIIADVSSSRRYAVELGLLERRSDTYRLSKSGTLIRWVEIFLQGGLERFAASASRRGLNSR